MWLVAFLYEPEFDVLARIRRVREHEAYLPVYRARTGEERPLYPGYIFLRYHHRWPSALEIRGIARVLGAYEGEQFWPHQIADEFVEKLRGSVIQERDEDGPAYQRGDMVRIKAGAWTGCFGSYQKRKHGTAVLDVAVFGRTVVVSLPLHQIEMAIPATGGVRCLEAARA